MTSPKNVLTVEGLKAYYILDHFGVTREVQAVDDITMSIRENEVYGIAGESSSGKTTLIKVLAAAIRPPLRVVDGSVIYNFGDLTIDPIRPPARRGRHSLEASLLYHAGLDERFEPCAADQAQF